MKQKTLRNIILPLAFLGTLSCSNMEKDESIERIKYTGKVGDAIVIYGYNGLMRSKGSTIPKKNDKMVLKYENGLVHILIDVNRDGTPDLIHSYINKEKADSLYKSIKKEIRQ